MSTRVDTWKGGDNLALVDKVASIASKHVGKYDVFISELTLFFGSQAQKVEILKSCLEKMKDIANRFKEDRRAPKSGQQVPPLFQVAEKLRETKKSFLKSTMNNDAVEITLGDLPPGQRSRSELQYITPVKNLKVAKVRTPKEFRREILAKLEQPVLTMNDLTEMEVKEATLYQEYLEEQAEAMRSRAWSNASVEKENIQMARLMEVAIRALLAENVKKYELYKDHAGQGEIRWDYNIKNLTTSENDVLYMTKASYVSQLLQIRGVDSMKPAELMQKLEAERVKFEWYVKIFMPTEEARKAVLELEQSLGQLVQTSLLRGSESMKLYVSMAEDNHGVQNNTTTLFSFYRTKFSRLQAGGVEDNMPTKSPIRQVNHITDDNALNEDDMPQEVREAYSILLQRPISKHPQGVPITETQRQKESTTVEAVWQLKDSVDKVAAWAGKAKRKQPATSDSDEDSDKNKNPKDKKKDDATSIKKLEQRLNKFERQHSKKTVSWQDKQKSDKSEQRKPICYDFQKGKCTRSNCRFQHEGHVEPQSERRRSIELPDNVCAAIKAGKRCEQKGCAANHGKFKKTAKRQCWNEEKGQLCYNLFGKEGCHFLHDDEYSKNE